MSSENHQQKHKKSNRKKGATRLSREIVVSFFKELRVHRMSLLLSLESTINN
jgi:hypothetical protein